MMLHSDAIQPRLDSQPAVRAASCSCSSRCRACSCSSPMRSTRRKPQAVAASRVLQCPLRNRILFPPSLEHVSVVGR